jgi:hypothetical protein
MTFGTIGPGSIVTVRTIKDRIEDDKGKLVRELTFQAPKGSMFLILVMGTLKTGEKFDDTKYDETFKAIGLMDIPPES